MARRESFKVSCEAGGGTPDDDRSMHEWQQPERQECAASIPARSNPSRTVSPSPSDTVVS